MLVPLYTVLLLVLLKIGNADVVPVYHSDDVVAMGCINSHFDTPSWTQGINVTQLLELTQQSGFRTMRDGILASDALTKLGLNTIAQVPLAKEMSYTNFIVPWLDIVASKVSSGRMVPFVEAANEPDLFWKGQNTSYTNRTGVKTYFPEAVFNELQDIWYYIDSNATLRDALDVIGPAWSELNDIPFAQDAFVPYVDYANYHPYPVGNCWAGVLEYDYMSSYYCTGDDPLNEFGYNYSDNAYVYEWAKKVYGDKQFIMSETGYPTVIGATSEETQGAYLPRLLFEAFLYNHKLICFYEIWDSGPDPNDSEENFGIIRYNLTVKPAYLALQSIFKLFSDEGVKFTPKPQDITVDVSPVGNFTRTEWVHWFITQKSNGDYLVPIWHEVSLHNVVPWPWLVLQPPSLPFTLTLHSFYAKYCVLYTFNPQGVMSSQYLEVVNGTVISSVASTTVSILQITPANQVATTSQASPTSSVSSSTSVEAQSTTAVGGETSIASNKRGKIEVYLLALVNAFALLHFLLL